MIKPHDDQLIDMFLRVFKDILEVLHFNSGFCYLKSMPVFFLWRFPATIETQKSTGFSHKRRAF